MTLFTVSLLIYWVWLWAQWSVRKKYNNWLDHNIKCDRWMHTNNSNIDRNNNNNNKTIPNCSSTIIRKENEMKHDFFPISPDTHCLWFLHGSNVRRKSWLITYTVYVFYFCVRVHTLFCWCWESIHYRDI